MSNDRKTTKYFVVIANGNIKWEGDAESDAIAEAQRLALASAGVDGEIVSVAEVRSIYFADIAVTPGSSVLTDKA